ncbi:MAG TPA: hypothetical protein VFA45_13005 [Actinomycetes bacterium]|jgi:hypothetical protein|nr:hypothetical protein [Actinomycetes bacterium]
MSLDADLVRDAETARERLIASQHAAEQARADYRHAIRRLHAAGGSLREIAEVLRLSHQRVTPDSRFKCSFCGKGARQARCVVARGLASAPGGAPGEGTRICDECLVLCEDILAETASS